MKTVAIVLNTPENIPPVEEKDIICADAGRKKINKKPIATIGDFDSTEIPNNENCIIFPKEKNETDGQLAIDYAKSLGYDKIVVYGATGGDIGHVLGNIGLLKYAYNNGVDCEIKGENFVIKLLTGDVRLNVGKSKKISLFPFFGDVLVRSSKGLFYPLQNLSLEAGTNRGLSNITTDDEVLLSIAKGYLLAIIF